MNIVLIGCRCSGKTSVGRLLAGRLNREFVDTDAEVEADAGIGIDNIVSEQGWPRFRELERGIVRTVSSRDGLVIATGGGVVMDPDNVRHLRANGMLFWLQADTEVLKERMGRDAEAGRSRPSLMGADPANEVARVMEARRPFYESACDKTVKAGVRAIPEVADAILGILGDVQPGREV